MISAAHMLEGVPKRGGGGNVRRHPLENQELFFRNMGDFLLLFLLTRLYFTQNVKVRALYGIDNKLLQWIANFLNNRKQRVVVKIDGSFCNFVDVLNPAVHN